VGANGGWPENPPGNVGPQASNRTTVLDGKRFFGRAQEAYAAAASCPDILKHLFSYEGDDLTEEHTSLLDCFTTMYGVDGIVADEEVFLAAKLNTQGKSLAEIQQAIDETFGRCYPFQTDTPSFQLYKVLRLWHPKDAALPEFFSDKPELVKLLRDGDYKSAERVLKEGAEHATTDEERRGYSNMLSATHRYFREDENTADAQGLPAAPEQKTKTSTSEQHNK
jgi:hypothetical protein